MVFATHWHESAMDFHVFPILIPPHASLPIPSLCVFPVHQPWPPISCIQPGLVVCFTFDSLLVSVLFSQNICFYCPPIRLQELPRWCSAKRSACQLETCKRRGFDPGVGKIPWRRAWQPTPVFLPGEPQGQRSLAGYSLKSWTRQHTHTH